MTLHQKAPSRGVAFVRADASDPAALVGQIKTAFEDFKATNDQRIKAIEAGKAVGPAHKVRGQQTRVEAVLYQ